MNKDIVLGIVRHILTGAGTILVTKGITDSGTLETGVGAVITLASVIWSMAHKKDVAEQIKTASLN